MNHLRESQKWVLDLALACTLDSKSIYSIIADVSESGLSCRFGEFLSTSQVDFFMDEMSDEMSEFYKNRFGRFRNKPNLMTFGGRFLVVSYYVAEQMKEVINYHNKHGYHPQCLVDYLQSKDVQFEEAPQSNPQKVNQCRSL